MDENRICPECGKRFAASVNHHRFCCEEHKDDFHNREKRLALRTLRAQQAEERRAG
jgi:hypothetical protein